MDQTSVISNWVLFPQLKFNLPIMFQLNSSLYHFHHDIKPSAILPVLHHPDGLLIFLIFDFSALLLCQILSFRSTWHFSRVILFLPISSAKALNRRVINSNLFTSQLISTKAVSWMCWYIDQLSQLSVAHPILGDEQRFRPMDFGGLHPLQGTPSSVLPSLIFVLQSSQANLIISPWSYIFLNCFWGLSVINPQA